MSDQMGHVPEHIPYTIVGQSHGEELTAAGVFEPMWTVMYRSEHGTTASIKVPDREYTAPNVDRLIQEKLDHIVAIHELGPEPHPENRA